MISWWKNLYQALNPYDAGDGLFWLWRSIPCLLMLWLLKSPEHQQAWHLLRRTDNMYCSSRVHFMYLGEAKSKICFIQNVNISFIIFKTIQHINQLIISLWPSDAIWRHMSVSTLAEVMACCLMAPSHYLNQCWLFISSFNITLTKSNVY